MACGEGYGTDVLARRARRVTGVDANPEAYEHARPSTRRPGVRFVRDLIETYVEPCDAVVFLQTIEHVKEPEQVLAPLQGDAAPGAPTSRRRTCSRSRRPGADKSDNPWHLREYRARRVPRALRERLRPRRAATASSTRASCARTSWRCARAGTACTPRSASPSPSTTASPRPSRRATSRCATGRSTARWTSSRCCDELRGRRGALALVLHSHMPYVEGFGTWPFGEEWLWEAVACVYLPLLELLDGAPVTVGLTPVLCDQLEAMRGEPGRALPALPARRSARRSTPRTRPASSAAGEPELAAEVRRAAGDYELAEQAFERRGRDLLARLRRARRVELWTSAATHALLPLLATDAGLRLQLATGTASHLRRFGAWGGGFWLPECAYAPGLERDLADHGVRAFCVDQTAVRGLRPPASRWRPRPARWPCRSTGRPSSWSGTTATATRPTAPTATTTAARCTTSSPGTTPAAPTTATPPLRAGARARARLRRARRASGVAAGGLLCCALDTELLGHWWYEGPAWLAAVLEEAPRQGLELVTVERGARARRARSARRSRASTWGRGKDLSTWDSPGVARWRSPRAAPSCARSPRPPGTRARGAALERAARELLALQASDWAFMATRELAGDYPGERLQAHGGAPGRRARRSGRLRRRAGARPAQPRPRPRPRRRSPRPDAGADPVLGVPAADRGRPRAPRAQARREPRRPGRRRARARPRARPGPARGGGRRRRHPPRARARAAARPGRVRRLDRAHELGHARRRAWRWATATTSTSCTATTGSSPRPATTSPTASARRSWSRSTRPSTAATRAGSTSTRSPTSTASSAGWPTAPSA